VLRHTPKSEYGDGELLYLLDFGCLPLSFHGVMYRDAPHTLTALVHIAQFDTPETACLPHPHSPKQWLYLQSFEVSDQVVRSFDHRLNAESQGKELAHLTIRDLVILDGHVHALDLVLFFLLVGMSEKGSTYYFASQIDRFRNMPDLMIELGLSVSHLIG
jgi:hypothetical protein